MLKVTEEQVQRAAMQAFEWNGFDVLQTSRRRFLTVCPGCSYKFRPSGGDGASKGVPDLLVRHKDWPKAMWLGVEVKGPKTAVSPEQKALSDKGAIVIIRSVEDVLELINELKADGGDR